MRVDGNDVPDLEAMKEYPKKVIEYFKKYSWDNSYRMTLSWSINDWLERHPDIKVIDIKFQMACWGTSEDMGTEREALIIYDDDEAKKKEETEN